MKFFKRPIAFMPIILLAHSIPFHFLATVNAIFHYFIICEYWANIKPFCSDGLLMVYSLIAFYAPFLISQWPSILLNLHGQWEFGLFDPKIIIANVLGWGILGAIIGALTSLILKWRKIKGNEI